LGAGDIEVSNSPNGGPNSFYGTRIQPLLNQHCVTCHGRSKHKSNLRLDSFDAMMRGGKHGAVVKPADIKGSELLRRVSLPQSDDDFMPPDNRRPLTPSDVKLLEQWIAAGASGTMASDAIQGAPLAAASPTAAEAKFEETDPAAIAKERANLAATVAQLQKRLPNVLDYQSRASADIVVTASWMGAKFGDSELALLAPLAEKIVSADFTNTAITDKSASVIALMQRLRALRLMHTKIGDVTVQRLNSLNQLELLNIFDTSVTPTALTALTHLPKLQQVYVGETKISDSASISPEIRRRLVF
jgi:hypothetical protein